MIRSVVEIQIVAAGVEQLFLLPLTVYRFRLTSLNNIPTTISLVVDDVVAYQGLSAVPNYTWDSAYSEFTTAKLYLSASQPGARVQLELWTGSRDTIAGGFDSSFDDSFDV